MFFDLHHEVHNNVSYSEEKEKGKGDVHAPHLALRTEGDGHLNRTYGCRTGGLASDAQWMSLLRRHAEPQPRSARANTRRRWKARGVLNRRAVHVTTRPVSIIYLFYNVDHSFKKTAARGEKKSVL